MNGIVLSDISYTNPQDFKTPMRKLTTLLCTLILFSSVTLAQDVLTLDKCIEIALENNLQVKTAENNVLIAKSNKTRALMLFLPDLNAAANYRLNFGLGFDETSGRFVDRITRSSSPGIFSSWTVFNGFQNTYRLKRRNYEKMSAENALSNAKLDAKNNVLVAYLNVTLDRERIRISEDRIKLLSGQLEREKQRESVGVGDMEQVNNFESQVATEKLNLVTLTNTLKADKLQLLQILTMDKMVDFDIEPETFNDADLLEQPVPFDQVLSASMTFSPGLKGANADYQASRFRYKEAISGMSPRLSISAAYGSGYSNNLVNDDGQEIFWRTQLSDNVARTVNFSLSIPIFNQFAVRNDMQVSRLTQRNAEISIKQAEQNVRNTAQQVYLDLVAAQETYKASSENLRALERSFEFAKTRYEAGRTDFYTYVEALNNKNRAEIELVNAKYTIVFRQKILDLLQGI